MNQLQKLRPEIYALLEGLPLQYMLHRIEEYPRCGKVYLSGDKKSCAVRQDHWLFIGGNYTDEAKDFIRREIIPDYPFSYIVPPTDRWMEALDDGTFPGAEKIMRSLYKMVHQGQASAGTRPETVRITEDLMVSAAGNLKMITDEVTTYESFEDFLERGFGFALLHGGKIKGFCTSEYQSENEVAIGIEVYPELQRKGYAREMTTAFLNEAEKRGLTVYWECFRDNHASSNTARTCGFEQVADYSTLYVSLN